MNYNAQQEIVVMTILLILILVTVFICIFYWQHWLNKKMTKLGKSIHERIKRK